jgi:hypothetical protein
MALTEVTEDRRDGLVFSVCQAACCRGECWKGDGRPGELMRIVVFIFLQVGRLRRNGLSDRRAFWG